jgi:hypothetical protein
MMLSTLHLQEVASTQHALSDACAFESMSGAHAICRRGSGDDNTRSQALVPSAYPDELPGEECTRGTYATEIRHHWLLGMTRPIIEETQPGTLLVMKTLCAMQVPMYSASGLRVQYLRVWEKSNSKVDKWIRKVSVPFAVCTVPVGKACSFVAQGLLNVKSHSTCNV